MDTGGPWLRGRHAVPAFWPGISYFSSPIPATNLSPHQHLTTGWDSGVTAQVWLKPFFAEAFCFVPTLLLV